MSIEKFNEAPNENLNRTDGTSLDREKQAIKDQQDLKYLQELRKAAWFKLYYERRLREERELHVRELENAPSWDDALTAQAQIRLIDKLLHMPENDRQIKFKSLNPGKTPQPED